MSYSIELSKDQYEIHEAVEKINEELFLKFDKLGKLDYLPILSYQFGAGLAVINLSIPSEMTIPEFPIWFSENDDRIYYEGSDKYETFYKYIKRKFLLIKKELNNIKL